MEIRKVCSCGFMGKDKDKKCINCNRDYDGTESFKYRCETCKKFKFAHELNNCGNCNRCKTAKTPIYQFN